MQSERLVFDHDTDGLAYISAFAAAIAPFGLFLEDLTDPDGETIEVRVTDTEPENEWSES